VRVPSGYKGFRLLILIVPALAATLLAALRSGIRRTRASTSKSCYWPDPWVLPVTLV